MKRVVTVVSGIVLACGELGAQVVTGLQASAITHVEVSETFRADGLGWGPFAEVQLRRIHVHSAITQSRLSRHDTTFSFAQFATHAGVRILPVLAVEVGLTRRWIDQAFGKEVLAIGVGAYSETRLSRIAVVRLRAASVPFATFRGGGSIGTSIELGFGSTLTSPGGGWRGQIDCSLLRFDRRIPGEARPMQTSIARLGVARAWSRDSRKPLPD